MPTKLSRRDFWLGASALPAQPARPGPAKPNIVLVLMDNFG